MAGTSQHACASTPAARLTLRGLAVLVRSYIDSFDISQRRTSSTAQLRRDLGRQFALASRRLDHRCHDIGDCA
eukprot:12942023-Alexandrium_andersonii.AAC.1